MDGAPHDNFFRGVTDSHIFLTMKPIFTISQWTTCFVFKALFETINCLGKITIFATMKFNNSHFFCFLRLWEMFSTVLVFRQHENLVYNQECHAGFRLLFKNTTVINNLTIINLQCSVHFLRGSRINSHFFFLIIIFFFHL